MPDRYTIRIIDTNMLKLPEIRIFKTRFVIQKVVRRNLQTAAAFCARILGDRSSIRMSTKVGDFTSNFGKMQRFKWTKPVIQRLVDEYRVLLSLFDF